MSPQRGKDLNSVQWKQPVFIFVEIACTARIAAHTSKAAPKLPNRPFSRRARPSYQPSYTGSDSHHVPFRYRVCSDRYE